MRPLPKPQKPVLAIGNIAPDTIKYEFFNAYVDTLTDLRNRGYTVFTAKHKSGPNIGPARNEICSSFLDRTTADYLLMVDSDMVFTADDVEEVLRVSRAQKVLSVVGGVCPAIHADGTKWVVAMGDGTTGTVSELDQRTEFPEEPFRISFTGAAFLLIPRKILELFPRVGDEKNPLDVADLGIEAAPKKGTGIWFSPTYAFRNAEDYAFCDRLKNTYGVPLIIAPKARIGHCKHRTIYP